MNYFSDFFIVSLFILVGFLCGLMGLVISVIVFGVVGWFCLDMIEMVYSVCI